MARNEPARRAAGAKVCQEPNVFVTAATNVRVLVERCMRFAVGNIFIISDGQPRR